MYLGEKVKHEYLDLQGVITGSKYSDVLNQTIYTINWSNNKSEDIINAFVCIYCKRLLPISSFRKRKRHTISSCCKECYNQGQRERVKKYKRFDEKHSGEQLKYFRENEKKFKFQAKKLMEVKHDFVSE